ncbi:hypothetical protein EDB80DRAFT_690893 [Ilyonectria destructans]|nr:hypothetical protein EDB80DRAFT_690893 [Ilyonectria destructans]
MASIIHTQVEINRSPAVVREIFLDFPRIRGWHQGVLTITRVSRDKSSIEEGDKLHTTFNGQSMTTSVLVQSGGIRPPVILLSRTSESIAKTLQNAFEKFNSDLKTRAESAN